MEAQELLAAADLEVEGSSAAEELTAHDNTPLSVVDVTTPYWDHFLFNQHELKQELIVTASTHQNEFGTAKENHFLKNVQWAPDGTCLLSNSEDNVLRILALGNIREGGDENTLGGHYGTYLQSVLKVKPGDTVYSTCWYPHMSSQDHQTCSFLSTSKAHPVHMWDAFTGMSRCTYRAYDHVDEIVAALSVSFNLAGDKIYCGYNNAIRIFHTAVPGRNCTLIPTKGKENRGLMSCISFNPDGSGVYAVGSYSKMVGLYSEKDENMIGVVEGNIGGITQVEFSQDGRYLFTGARKDNEILCWDIRNTGNILFRFERVCANNQHIGFHVHRSGHYLITGCQSGALLAYDLTTDGRLLYRTNSDFGGVVNSVAFHPSVPCVALGTGERKFCLPSRHPDEEEEQNETQKGEEDKEKGKEKEEQQQQKRRKIDKTEYLNRVALLSLPGTG